MFRIVAAAIVLTFTACAANVEPIHPGEFVPHGRFPAANPEQARLECRLQSEQAGRQTYATGAPGALPTLYGPPPAVLRAMYDTLRVCMESKGYRWTKPR